MSDSAKAFLERWFVTTLGVLAASRVVDGVNADTWMSLLAASLLLGIFNAILRPILLIATLPLLLLTLGLFTFVINALLLYFVGNLVKGFSVDGFWPAFKGALLISIVSLFASMMFGRKRVAARPQEKTTPRRPDHSGGGPVIDV